MCYRWLWACFTVAEPDINSTMTKSTLHHFVTVFSQSPPHSGKDICYEQLQKLSVAWENTNTNNKSIKQSFLKLSFCIMFYVALSYSTLCYFRTLSLSCLHDTWSEFDFSKRPFTDLQKMTQLTSGRNGDRNVCRAGNPAVLNAALPHY